MTRIRAYPRYDPFVLILSFAYGTSRSYLISSMVGYNLSQENGSFYIVQD
jgi:hypothetical protein